MSVREMIYQHTVPVGIADEIALRVRKQKRRAARLFGGFREGLAIAPGSARLNKAMAKTLDQQGNTMDARIYHQRADAILPGFELQ